MDGDVQEVMEATRRGRKKEVETMNDDGNEREVPGKGSTKTSSFVFFPFGTALSFCSPLAQSAQPRRGREGGDGMRSPTPFCQNTPNNVPRGSQGEVKNKPRARESGSDNKLEM